MKSKLIKIFLLLLIIFGVYYGVYAKDVLDAKKPKTQSLFKVSQTESILLKSRKFTPAKGISSVLVDKIKARAPKKTHVLLQFETLPTTEQKKQLSKNGVKLLAYIPNNTWMASIINENPEEITNLFNIRAIIEILPEDKISPAVKNTNYLKNEDGTVNLLVMFFNDVDLEEASLMLKKYGQVADKSYSINAVKLVTEEKFIAKLANQETVQWIDVTDKILYTHNDSNRENIGVNILQASPYNLSGAGIVTAEWDGGWIDATHGDLQGRVTIGDTGSSVGAHATHVAGTMLGDGTLGGAALEWRGMAPQATVISYEWWNDSTELNSEYDTAINTYNASLSQNSWGYTYPRCRSDCSGGYDSPASELDGLVRGSKGKKINIIWSAGNARPSGCDSGEYDCIGIPGTAKNIITVGATNSDDDSMTFFSSWGPTNDGRLKPEVTAPGCEGDKNDGTITGSVWSTVPTNTYAGMCGTSMAAPTVSGMIALMLEEFATEAIYPLPSTIKALLTHTAKDLGNTGPDYSFGYGRIQGTTTIDKIKAGSYIEDSVGHWGTDTYSLNVPAGTTEIKITLVWDDEPATAYADPALVNDLDLIVKDPSNTQYYPWTLNPASPSSPAVQTQADHLNNIEQVLVNTSITPGIWTIEVYGYTVPFAPQTYSLIFTPNYGGSVTGKLYKDSGYTNEEQFFDETEPVYIEAYVTSAGSPLTGAVVTADLILVNSSSTIAAITLQDMGGGYYRESWDSTSQPAGVYSVNINVASPALNFQKYFHLYPQAGVSSYRFDYNNDGNNDYVLENKHLIAIFDGKTNTDKSLLYLEQKDTDLAYTFSDISDTDTIGRGEITTTNLKGINKFYSFSLSQAGEALATATLNMTTEVSDPTEELITYYDSSNGDGDYFIDDDQWIGERFNPADLDTDYTLTKISVYVGKGSRASNPLTVEIRTDSSGSPSDTILISESIPASSVPSSSAWLDVTFSSQITLEQGGLYWLVLRNTNTRQGNPDNPNYAYTWTGDGTSPTYPGRTAFSQDRGTSWTDGTASFDMIFRAYGYPVAITTILDVAVQMKTEDVDYLVYKLSNFDEYIDDISNIFSPISGTLGSSIADDRYHFGDGSDGLISSLTDSTWTNFTTSSNQQRYVAIYDNSTSNDTTAENVISWVYFPNASSIAFQDVGAWYETGKGGLRLKYDTTSSTATNEAEYILAFTKGGWSTIDFWMPTIASGQFPSPNFMTATSTRLNFPVNAWQMISIPLEPTTSTPESIIGDDVEGIIFSDWMLAYWKPAEEAFQYHRATCCPWSRSTTSLISMVPGLSYWLATRLGPYDIDATGSLVPDSDYYISVLPGWNQIGVPFNYSVAWASSTIKVKYGTTIVDIDTAQSNGWMENKIWWWDGTEYQFAVTSEGQLDPWLGYWVYSTTSNELIISPTPTATAETATSMTLLKQEQSSKTEKQKKPKWKDAESEWKLRLMITTDDKRDTYNFAGMSLRSEDGYDAWDVAEPPAISSGIALYFPHLDWPFAGGNYAQDMKKLDSKNKKWYFEVKNEVQQMPITLKWLNLEQAVYHSLSLMDLDTNQSIDLYNTTEYIFDLEKGGIRHFELSAQKAKGKEKLLKKK